MSEKWEQFKRTNRRRTVTDKVLQRMAQEFSFTVPILPGDSSLIEDFLADIDILLRQENPVTTHSLRLLHVAPSELDVTGTLGNGQAMNTGRATSSLDASADNSEKPVRLRQSKRARIAQSV